MNIIKDKLKRIQELQSTCGRIMLHRYPPEVLKMQQEISDLVVQIKRELKW